MCNYMCIFILFCEVIKYLGKKSVFPSFHNCNKFNMLLFLVMSCSPDDSQVKKFWFFFFLPSSKNNLQICLFFPQLNCILWRRVQEKQHCFVLVMLLAWSLILLILSVSNMSPTPLKSCLLAGISQLFQVSNYGEMCERLQQSMFSWSKSSLLFDKTFLNLEEKLFTVSIKTFYWLEQCCH